MKLSKREKILILILIICLLVFIANKIVYLNLFSSNSIKEEHAKISSAYINMTQNIKMRRVYEKEIQNINSEINSLKSLSVLEQEKIIVTLNNYMTAYNIELNNITFTEPIFMPLENINTRTDEYIEDENNNATVDNVSKISIITVNIDFKSNYDDMLGFIDAIQKNVFDTAITSINLVMIDEVFVQCTVTLNFYAYPLINELF